MVDQDEIDSANWIKSRRPAGLVVEHADVYHRSTALSSSILRLVARKSMQHVRARLDGLERQTDAMAFGTLLHTAALEPETWLRGYACAPADRRTKEGKAQAAELEAAGKIVVSRDDWGTIAEMVGALGRHPVASKLIQTATHREVSCYSLMGERPVKARFDALAPGQIVDLKTTTDASPRGFERELAKYGYHAQAAWYLDVAKATGLDVRRFLIVAVEKTAPYVVGVYQIDELAIARGREENLDAIAALEVAERTGEWPGYGSRRIDRIQQIGLPRWYGAEDEEDEF